MSNERATTFSRHVSPRWEAPATVDSFRISEPNEDLLRYARELQSCRIGASSQPLRVLDIGGGAGRNALPLARLGLDVVCTDFVFANVARRAHKTESGRSWRGCV
jgi:2-polyprenyl-3-methyl-5-hydroxy-6-metoxy-1,4-benzoquinol methylase